MIVVADDKFIADGNDNLENVLVLKDVAETFPLVVELVVDVDLDVLVELCVDVVLCVDVGMVVDIDVAVDVVLGVDAVVVLVNGDVEVESGTVAVDGWKGVVVSATEKIRH